jgi:hypothetical protein
MKIRPTPGDRSMAVGKKWAESTPAHSVGEGEHALGINEPRLFEFRIRRLAILSQQLQDYAKPAQTVGKNFEVARCPV